MCRGGFMNIEKFLMENLVDIYGNYCESVDGTSPEEFDELFKLEDGSLMSDLDFFLKHSEDILNEEVVEELYCYLSDVSMEKDYSLEQIVSFLASKYFLFNYGSGNSSVVKFLKRASLQDIENLFVENINFGVEMVGAYFHSLNNTKRCETNRRKIYENNDQDILLDFESKNLTGDIITINTLLRRVVCNLYNNYIFNGCDDIEALNMTWDYFFRDFDPLGELDQLGFDYESKQLYKNYLLGLIYADLYEDVCNESIIESENYEDRMAMVIPLLIVRMGKISIPREEGTRNRILKHFILLQDEKEKISENRQKTYQDDRIAELKKVNPLYLLDELTF